MSRKVCDTWFYAILICSVGVSLYYYYPEVQNRFPQATAILEMHYKKITSQFVSSMQPYVPLLRSISLPPGMFNADTLARYDGKTGSKGLYLALLGKVYDVEKGAKYYREGGSYSFFAGKDASRAYITGDFSDTGLTDDLTGLSEESVAGLANWIEMYHKDYPYMGKLVGRYYTITGEKTAELRRIEELLSRAQAVKDKEDEQKKMFPPCNSEFNTKTGHRVWCSNQRYLVYAITTPR